MLVVNIRNLSRFIRLSIPEKDAEDRAQKAAILKLLTAFAVATKLQLRGEPANDELKALLSEKQAVEIDSAKRLSLLDCFVDWRVFSATASAWQDR